MKRDPLRSHYPFPGPSCMLKACVICGRHSCRFVIAIYPTGRKWSWTRSRQTQQSRRPGCSPTLCGSWRSTRWRRRIPAIPARRWAWPTSPRCCGATICGTIRPIPKWPNRDRFVLSNGHGSMLLYALLHLTGYDLPIEELKHFRQLHSKTPGHPEYGLTPGCGNHHRAAGPGHRHRRRHGAGRAATGASVQPPRPHHRRSPDLRVPAATAA